MSLSRPPWGSVALSCLSEVPRFPYLGQLPGSWDKRPRLFFSRLLRWHSEPSKLLRYLSQWSAAQRFGLVKPVVARPVRTSCPVALVVTETHAQQSKPEESIDSVPKIV